MTFTEEGSMARSRHSLSSILLGTVILANSVPVAATEGAAGHYIIGAYATPGAGIVPPQPGLYWSDSNLYYGASVSSKHQIPVGGNIVSGLRAEFSSFALSAIYVPRVDLGKVTIAAGITLPG